MFVGGVRVPTIAIEEGVLGELGLVYLHYMVERSVSSTGPHSSLV